MRYSIPKFIQTRIFNVACHYGIAQQSELTSLAFPGDITDDGQLLLAPAPLGPIAAQVIAIADKEIQPLLPVVEPALAPPGSMISAAHLDPLVLRRSNAWHASICQLRWCSTAQNNIYRWPLHVLAGVPAAATVPPPPPPPPPPLGSAAAAALPTDCSDSDPSLPNPKRPRVLEQAADRAASGQPECVSPPPPSPPRQPPHAPPRPNHGPRQHGLQQPPSSLVLRDAGSRQSLANNSTTITSAASRRRRVSFSDTDALALNQAAGNEQDIRGSRPHARAKKARPSAAAADD